MEHQNKIKNLVSEFHQGEITDEGLKDLLKHTKKSLPDDEMENFLENTWQESAKGGYPEFSGTVYQHILEKTKLAPDAGKRRNYQLPVSILRYAAVFLLAFGLSWFVRGLIQGHSGGAAKIVMQKIEVPYGSKSRILLSDGTKVILNSGSTLAYPSVFEGNSRTVTLTGEAFFDVTKDKTKPFFVHTSGIRVKVLGTTFNVKAYPEDGTIETTLVTGQVQIFTGKQNEHPDMTLAPSQKAVFTKVNSQILKLEEENSQKQARVNVPNENVPKKLQTVSAKVSESIAWKDNQLVFDNEEFSELSARIERWFNVEITLDYPALKNARFSGKFDKETIEQALNAMILATPFKYSINKNKITIYKN